MIFLGGYDSALTAAGSHSDHLSLSNKVHDFCLKGGNVLFLSCMYTNIQASVVAAANADFRNPFRWQGAIDLATALANGKNSV